MRDSLVNHGPVAGVRLDADYTTLSAAKPDYSEVADITCRRVVTRPAAAPEGSVAHIRLTLVDEEGRIQQMQPRRFRVETEGPIRLLGVETGDMRRMDSWRTTELETYFGEGLVRLQSTTEKGTAKVTFHVEGFDEPFIKKITIF